MSSIEKSLETRFAHADFLHFHWAFSRKFIFTFSHSTNTTTFDITTLQNDTFLIATLRRVRLGALETQNF